MRHIIITLKIRFVNTFSKYFQTFFAFFAFFCFPPYIDKIQKTFYNVKVKNKKRR
jgi:hypothetical protein